MPTPKMATSPNSRLWIAPLTVTYWPSTSSSSPPLTPGSSITLTASAPP